MKMDRGAKETCGKYEWPDELGGTTEIDPSDK